MAKMLQKSKSIFKTLIDIVLPPVCYVCGEACSSKYGLCDECLTRIKICKPHDSHIKMGWACSYYTDTIKECIHLFKYKGYIGLIDIFRDIMVDFIKKNRIDREVDLFVPVPIYSTKRRERSYNHSEVLARALSKYFAIPLDTKNLKKIKWSQPQSELDKEKRLKNVSDTFLIVDKNAFAGKRILLIDDVYTTGATINECAKVLRGAGASKVFSLTLARGI